jgi:hypothetical protein
MSSIEFWAALVIAMIAAIPGVAAMIRQIRRDKPDIAIQYQELASKQAADNHALELENATIRKEIFQLHKAVDRLVEANVEAEDYIRELTSYIEDLVNLMKSCGVVPVKPMPKRKEAVNNG